MLSDSAILRLMDRCERIATIAENKICNSSSNAVRCDCVNLENVDITGDPSDNMKEIRIRCVVGYDEAGKPIVKRLGAYNELDLSDKVIKAVVASGRIRDFLKGTEYEATGGAGGLQETLEASRTPFKSYVTKWRATYKTGLEKTTQAFYDAKENVLNRFFGEMVIEDITTETIQNFLTDRAERYKKATVEADLGVLREILDSAVYDGIIKQNPAKDRRIRIVAKPGEGTKALTREQVAEIMTAIPTMKSPVERCLMGLLVYTSMRREEVLGLEWDCVDFERSEILIRNAVVYCGKGVHKKGTKNAYSVRRFPMCDPLRDILEASKRDRGYVVADAEGEPLTAYKYRALFSNIKKNINLYGMTARNFRTTFSTLAVASGVDIRTTQSLMGHSDPDTTLRIYTKQDPETIRGAMDKINSFVCSDA